MAAPGRDRARRRLLPLADREVEVANVATERRVADRAADDPRLAPAERLARRDDRGRAREPVGDPLAAPRHRATRGTRAEIPQVTS